MGADSLVPSRFLVAIPVVLECFVIHELGEFQRHGVMPHCVAVLLINAHGILRTLWNLETKLVSLGLALGTQLRLIDEAFELLFILGDSFETFPSWFVKQSVLLGVQCTRDGIIGANHAKGLKG